MKTGGGRAGGGGGGAWGGGGGWGGWGQSDGTGPLLPAIRAGMVQWERDDTTRRQRRACPWGLASQKGNHEVCGTRYRVLAHETRLTADSESSSPWLRWTV
jgi:hypothetical protein